MTLGTTSCKDGLVSDAAWNRPICEVLQRWRSSLASLVFLIIVIINLFGVTIGSVVVGDSSMETHHMTEGSRSLKDGTGLSGTFLYNTYSIRDKREALPGDKGGGLSGGGSSTQQPAHHSTTNIYTCDSYNNASHISLKDKFSQILSNLTSSLPSLTPGLSKQCLYRGYQDLSSQQHNPHNTLTLGYQQVCSNNIPKIANSSVDNRTTVTQSSSSSIVNIDSSNNVTNKVCKQPAGNGRIERTQQLRKEWLPFCNMFPLYSTVNLKCDKECHELNRASVSNCRSCVDKVLELDRTAYAMFIHFQNVFLLHLDCRDDITHWNCSDCETAYKNWLCSMTIPFYKRGELLPPCTTYCEEVEEKCPYMLPELDYQYVGQPSFLCTVPDIPNQTFSFSNASDNCHTLRNLRNLQPNQTPSHTSTTTVPNQSGDANQRTPLLQSDPKSDNNGPLSTKENDISDKHIKRDNTGRTDAPWDSKGTSFSNEEETVSSGSNSQCHRHRFYTLAQFLVVLLLLRDWRAILQVTLFYAFGLT